MHYIDNDYGPETKPTHIIDMDWQRANPAGNTHNPNFPSSSPDNGHLYSPAEANQLAQLSQEHGMRNAANFQWFLWGMSFSIFLQSYAPSFWMSIVQMQLLTFSLSGIRCRKGCSNISPLKTPTDA